MLWSADVGLSARSSASPRHTFAAFFVARSAFWQGLRVDGVSGASSAGGVTNCCANARSPPTVTVAIGNEVERPLENVRIYSESSKQCETRVHIDTYFMVYNRMENELEQH